ncbi:hypothetical protein [Absidia glauca]|uniref:Uncharacterized protein n=1 Tax=Absidia glauca TaxID=4829 RepID=A0A163J9I3_ABSGL|nr:hypothetical protein [Absidia glauca]
MTLSYLANGETLSGVDFNTSSMNSLSLLANEDQSDEQQPGGNEQPTSPISALNLRRCNLNYPTDVTPYLSLYATLPHTLVTLDLSKNGLSDLPLALEHLNHLRELNLAWNHFTQLPPVLYALTHLQHLNISGNALGDLNRLPEALPCLQTLRANDNRLEQLDDLIGLWQDMVHLQLGGNELTFISDTLTNMVRLEELDLSNNQLHTWPPSPLPTLKHLKLPGNQITTLPIDMHHCFPKLETIDISTNQLSSLPCITNTDGALQSLNLSNNKIYIMPTSVLTLCPHIDMSGNPALEYHRTSIDTYAQRIRDLSKVAVYSTPHNDSHIDMLLIDLLDSPSTLDTNHPSNTPEATIIPTTPESPPLLVLNDPSGIFTKDGPAWIPSLRELAMRYMVADPKVRHSAIPCTLAGNLWMDMRCDICGNSCVNEWLSALQVKTHQTYASVVCKLALCSTSCWLRHYRQQRRSAITRATQVLETTPLSRAMATVPLPLLHTLEPDSFEWIVAAAAASAIQREEDQALE